MTPDICVSALKEGYISFENLNLLILDQCQLVVSPDNALQQVNV